MVWMTVDVDLEDISDDDIKQEYLRRDLGGENEVAEQAKQLVQYIRCNEISIDGKFSDDLIEFIHDLANKVIV